MKNLPVTLTSAFLLVLLAVTPAGAAPDMASQIAKTWRAEGFVIPNHPQGVSVITLNDNGSFRAQLGVVGTGTVSGQTASGSWRLQDNILSFVVMLINNASAPPALSQPILFQIDLVTDTEVRCRNQHTGRNMRFVRIGS